LLLVVVSLWEIAATRCDATSVPDDDAWHRAAAVVRADYRPGDLIVFAPDWVDPVGRLHLGDLIPVEVAARMDAARFARIWELSIRGARAPETIGLDPVATTEVDGVTVRRFDQRPAAIVADVRDHFAEARVQGGRATLELAEVGFAPHRCIQVVPPAGKLVRVVFPSLSLGSELVGYVGIADVFTRRDVRSPGHLDVDVGGRRISVEPGIDDGWVRFALPTTPGSAEVVFTASARDAGRLICFAAEARL
jgi:hypothetical protein